MIDDPNFLEKCIDILYKSGFFLIRSPNTQKTKQSTSTKHVYVMKYEYNFIENWRLKLVR